MGEQEPPKQDPDHDPDPRIDRGRTAAAMATVGGLTLIARGALGLDRITLDFSKPELMVGSLLVCTVVIIAGGAISSGRK